MDQPIDVFISYPRAQRREAGQLAQALTDLGYEVTFDPGLRHGENFADALDAQLRASKCVLVLWTEAAVQSDWVRNEARLAAALGTFLPVVVGQADRPVDLRGAHAVMIDTLSDPRPVLGAVVDRIGPPGLPDLDDFRKLLGAEVAARRTPPSGPARAPVNRHMPLGQALRKMFDGSAEQTPASGEGLFSKFGERKLGYTALEAMVLTELDLSRQPQESVADLRMFQRLRVLNLHNTRAPDWEPISTLTELEELFLDGTDIPDLNPLRAMRKLTGLHLADTPVTDVTRLAGCTHLEWLNLRGTAIRDLGPLKGLAALGGLTLPDGTRVGSVITPETAASKAEVRAFLDAL